MDECPVCLENLTGTVVHMECCKKQVHIQCYLTKCPMCRASLPSPPSLSVIVPVPVPVYQQTPRRTRSQSACLFITVISVASLIVVSPQFF